ncbi:hypothetical protein RG959_19715, partial [Domibacillus sp. 8LH]|uniref:hypothetical protein n=1 Tax=Domibacillus sp. 8LH TaxID=3073900 RepID=UPI00316DD197
TAVKLFSADGSWGFPPVRAGRRQANSVRTAEAVLFISESSSMRKNLIFGKPIMKRQGAATVTSSYIDKHRLNKIQAVFLYLNCIRIGGLSLFKNMWPFLLGFSFSFLSNLKSLVLKSIYFLSECKSIGYDSSLRITASHFTG